MSELPVAGLPVAVLITTGAFCVSTSCASIPPTEIIVSAVAVSNELMSAVTFVPDPSVYLASSVVLVA